MKNKYFYFLMGYATAILMAIVVSCSLEPINAHFNECGDEEWNPCWVKITE